MWLMDGRKTRDSFSVEYHCPGLQKTLGMKVILVPAPIGLGKKIR
jgi:hypothetical protein